MLVVENDPNDIFLLAVAAQEMCPDISFVFVPTACEALAYLRGEGPFARESTRPSPDVLLLDVQLAPGGAHALVERIRRNPEFKNMKVVLWTDGLEPGFEEHARRAGADLYFRKPLAFSELITGLKRIRDLAQPGDST